MSDLDDKLKIGGYRGLNPEWIPQVGELIPSVITVTDEDVT